MVSLSIKERCKLVILAVGLFISHTLMSIFQQKIYEKSYDGEKFLYPTAYVALQCFIYMITAKAITLSHDHPKSDTPQKYFVFVAIFYLLAMTTSNMALKYVPYVIQVVGKACKPIPVMILAVIFVQKSYKVQKYLFIIMLVIGIAIFIYDDKHKKKSTENPLIGNILIGISLFFDGMLCVAQDKMRLVSKPTSMNFMYYVNAWSSLFVLPMLLINFEGLGFIEFCMRHTNVIYDLAIVVVCGTFGQYFISAIISNYGSLTLSLVTTTRKFFTVLFSALIFGNVLCDRQWIATGLIFTALTLDVLFGKKHFGTKEEIDDSEQSTNDTVIEKV